uniref:Uncharacterized protein n=1 Tax=Anser brachyrhynchus TaxID=132585 RepID=A0A8B9I5C4_9AVES
MKRNDKIFVASFLLYTRLLPSRLPPSRVSSPELPSVCSTAKGQSARSYCSQVPRWAWRRRNELQDCKRKPVHPTNLLLSMNSFRNPSPVGSSLPSSPAGCSGPQQTLASLPGAKHTGTAGPGSARLLLQPDLAEPPGSPNFCLCSKSVSSPSTRRNSPASHVCTCSGCSSPRGCPHLPAFTPLIPAWSQHPT